VLSPGSRLVPRKAIAKARAAEHSYSHRSLLDKLGVKPGQQISVLGVRDASFLKDLAARVPAFADEKQARVADLVFLAAEDLESLAHLEKLAKTVGKNTAIWVVYPKGQKHIRETDVMNAGKSAGLTDNKVCSFSSTHTALRFVIPLARR
jgi:hypothetical protein